MSRVAKSSFNGCDLLMNDFAHKTGKLTLTIVTSFAEYLGHTVSKEELQADTNTVEAVQKFPVPKRQNEVKSYLGLVAYYRVFIPKYAEIARPLNKASETSLKHEWTTAVQIEFESLKLKLTSTPVLDFPCMRGPFILNTDGCYFAFGAVLDQMQNC